jgi:2-dehydro-3-deoxyphosphogalactonate aldolase
VVKAMLAVLPKGTALVPVGGVNPGNMGAFLQAGVAGFGLGSGLFKPGQAAVEIAERAAGYMQAWRRYR